MLLLLLGPTFFLIGCSILEKKIILFVYEVFWGIPSWWIVDSGLWLVLGFDLFLLSLAILEKGCSRNANVLCMRCLRKYPVSGLWILCYWLVLSSNFILTGWTIWGKKLQWKCKFLQGCFKEIPCLEIMDLYDWHRVYIFFLLGLSNIG